ncbi:hypothetical protein HA466_0208620 [Hirschfeldia incana]|nr:hypothetical protein HA466_0208620 [Hirschfeldia incana]
MDQATNRCIGFLDSTAPYDEDRFRFHSYDSFESNCDLKGGIYDVVGHMKLVNGQTVTERSVLEELDVETARHLLWTCDETLSLGQGSKRLLSKFQVLRKHPTVLLVTTVNTKRLRGTLALTSMSSSCVFMDNDVQPTVEYLAWLCSNPENGKDVNAEVVTKREPLTLGQKLQSTTYQARHDL